MSTEHAARRRRSTVAAPRATYCPSTLVFIRRCSFAREGSVPSFTKDVVIVGGCGRVGLPLGLALADAGRSVVLYDLDAARGRPGPRRQDAVRRGRRRRAAGASPGHGPARGDADPAVGRGSRARRRRRRHAGRRAPQPRPAGRAAAPSRSCATHLRDGQLLVLRSTVYPGVTALVEQPDRATRAATIDVAFCPERIAEGKAMTELLELPQIVSGRTERAVDAGREAVPAPHRRRSSPRAGGGRARQAVHQHLALHQVRRRQPALHDRQRLRPRLRAHPRTRSRYDYPRAADMPGAGFAAGPCLLKDTMQLAAFNNNNFTLGHASMMVNEGLPLYLVSPDGAAATTSPR